MYDGDVHRLRKADEVTGAAIAPLAGFGGIDET
jgi:hypothetical protein